MRDQSKGLFRGLSSNHEYMALSKVGPSQSECIARFARTFSIGTSCVTSPRGCFEGIVRTIDTWPCLKLNLPRRPFRVPVAPCAQSECIAHFARTFSIGTPRATSPRGCFEGLLRTLNTQPCPKLDLPSPSASLASLTPSLLEHHMRPV